MCFITAIDVNLIKYPIEIFMFYRETTCQNEIPAGNTLFLKIYYLYGILKNLLRFLLFHEGNLYLLWDFNILLKDIHFLK